MKRIFWFFWILLLFSFQSKGQGHDLDRSFLKMIENKGQWNSNIAFKAQIPEGYVYAAAQGLVYRFYDPNVTSRIQKLNHEGRLSSLHNVQIPGHEIHVNFHGVSKGAEWQGGKAYPEKRNYFLGNDPAHWASNVASYQDLWNENVYKNVDFHLFQNQKSLKYEFVVHPGGNYHNIGMDIEGAERVFLKNGDLHIETSVNALVEAAPFAYQRINNKIVEVPCEFALKGNSVYYRITGYVNPEVDLVIDPQLIFATYSGSEADNWGNTACLDDEGNLYTGGTVFQFDAGIEGDLASFPATPGAFQTFFRGGHTDIGILKFEPNGDFLIFATYIGGNGAEIPTSTIVDERSKELLILGTTASTNFPTLTNAYDRTFNRGVSMIPVGGYAFIGGTDMAIIRLGTDGDRLSAATYFGGRNNDGVLDSGNPLVNNYGDQLRGDINVDEEGNVYVASTTSSTPFDGFPVTAGAYDVTFGGGETDGCVFKMNPDLSDLLWCTYLGGEEEDALFSIKRDAENNVYVAGGTVSENFPTVDGLNETEIGEEDGIISLLSSDGDSLMASTRLGTSAFDQVYFVDLDDEGDVYALGQTTGNYPVTPGVYFNDLGGVFIQKLTKDLDSSYFSTVLGSLNATDDVIPGISPTAFLVNDCNNMLFSGWGGVANSDFGQGSTFGLPVTDNAFQSTTDGSDFYFMVLEADASSLLYATFFGGPNSREHVDGGTSRFDKTGVIYQSVCAGCGGFDTDFLFYVPDQPDKNPNTYPKENPSGNCNNGVIKFDLASLEADIGNAPTCIPLTNTFFNNSLGGINYTWIFGDGDTIITEIAEDVTHTFPEVGPYTVKLIATDLTTCKKRDTFYVDVIAIEPLDPRSYADTLCPGETGILTVETDPRDASYQWSPTANLSNPNSSSTTHVNADTSYLYTITIIDTLGCDRVDTFDLTVPMAILDFGYEIIGNCKAKEPPLLDIENNSFSNLGEGSTAWRWIFGNDGQVLDYSPSYQFSTFDSFTVVLEATVAGCPFDTSFHVVLDPVEFPNIITPNGDDKNERFVISGLEGTGDWQFDVYNRWGDPVYKNEVYDNTWEGTNLSVGTYYFLITSPDGNKCKNWVEIIR